MTTVGRLGALALGLICAGLGCFGTYEFAYRLEGSLSIPGLAATVIAGTAALIPPIAEATWRAGGYLKALLWWAVLVPVGAVVFFSAAERVHDAKAGAEAERGAFRSAAAGASAVVTRAEAELATARNEANKARAKSSAALSAGQSLPQRRRLRPMSMLRS
jgi:hypothetical protein